MKKVFIFVLFFIVSCGNNPIGRDVIDYSFGLCENNGELDSLQETADFTYIKVRCKNRAEFNVARLWDEPTRKYVLKVF